MIKTILIALMTGGLVMGTLSSIATYKTSENVASYKKVVVTQDQ